MIGKSKAPLLPGWRIFRCSECGRHWESTSRDYSTPSGDECEGCGEWVFPYDSRPDATLPVNEFGNLTNYITKRLTP